MSNETSVAQSLALNIIERLEALLLNAEQETKPLEIDPCRSQLFELFVTAEGAGLVSDESDPDLSADGICRVLSERWGLAAAAQDSHGQQEKMAPKHVGKMRLLWSLMRMWMEWTYAWERWPEFHQIGE